MASPTLGLPLDVLCGAIFSRLSTPRDVAQASQVCKQWSTLVPQSTRALALTAPGTFSVSGLCLALRTMPNLEALAFLDLTTCWRTAWKELDMSMLLVALAQHCPRLRSLEASADSTRQEFGIGTVACMPAWPTLELLMRRCPDLQVLATCKAPARHFSTASANNRGVSTGPVYFSALTAEGPTPRLAPSGADLGGDCAQASALALPEELSIAVGHLEALRLLKPAPKSRLRHLHLHLSTSPDPPVLLTPAKREEATSLALDLAAGAPGLVSLALSGLGLSPSLGAMGPRLERKLAALGTLRNLRELHLLYLAPEAHEEGRVHLDDLALLGRLEVLSIRNLRCLANIDAVTALRALRELSIVGSSIGGIPPGISRLSRLQVLVIANCQSPEFKVPDEIGQLVHLRVLKLCGVAGLEDLPESLECLEKLEMLDLASSDGLVELPRGLSGLRALRILNLTDTALPDPGPSAINPNCIVVRDDDMSDMSVDGDMGLDMHYGGYHDFDEDEDLWDDDDIHEWGPNDYM